MSENTNTSHTEIFLLKFLVGLSLLGAFIVWLMVQQFRQQTIMKTGRAPAAAATSEIAAALMLSCKNKNEEKDTKAQVVRFIVEDCPTGLKTKTPWTLTNRTNGFSATWFDLSQGHRSSDFIDLKVGKNDFEWSVVDELGREQKIAFSITRLN